jgi:hypothetical protein
MNDWAMIQTWRQLGEDLRCEAETRQLARARCGRSPGAVPHELRAKEGTKRSGVESRIE